MESLFRYIASPSPCSYLPDQLWSLEYEHVAAMSAAEYLQRMIEGWRRFGTMLFRPACQSCHKCLPIRVVVDRFQPSQSQKRARKANEGEVELRIGTPSVTRAKLALYDRYHDFQADAKGWPQRPAKDTASYAGSFVHQPFEVEEWCYYLHGRLVGVGYVDALPPVYAAPGARMGPGGRVPLALAGQEPLAGGLSAIYFFYEPALRNRSLGTWNVLALIEEAARRRLPYVYLGYYVEGCSSMAYKPKFIPNQIRDLDGRWQDFLWERP
jgi:arginine-tRNA-protein transferase